MESTVVVSREEEEEEDEKDEDGGFDVAKIRPDRIDDLPKELAIGREWMATEEQGGDRELRTVVGDTFNLVRKNEEKKEQDTKYTVSGRALQGNMHSFVQSKKEDCDEKSYSKLWTSCNLATTLHWTSQPKTILLFC